MSGEIVSSAYLISQFKLYKLVFRFGLTYFEVFLKVQIKDEKILYSKNIKSYKWKMK